MPSACGDCLSGLCLTTLNPGAGERLGQVQENLEKIMETFRKQTSANKCASQEGLLALAAARHALSVTAS